MSLLGLRETRSLVVLRDSRVGEFLAALLAPPDRLMSPSGRNEVRICGFTRPTTDMNQVGSTIDGIDLDAIRSSLKDTPVEYAVVFGSCVPR